MERYQQQVTEEPKRKPGFQKGQPRPEGAGRRKGSVNAVPRLLKDLVLMAAENVGHPEPVYAPKKKKNGDFVTKDGNVVYTDRIIGWRKTGKDGILGILEWYAVEFPGLFMQALLRAMPLQVEANVTTTDDTVTSRFANLDTSKMTIAQLNATFREIVSLTRPLPPPPKLVGQSSPRMIEGEVETKGEAA